MKIEDKALSVCVRLDDGQEISVWVWDEKDRPRARRHAENLATHLSVILDIFGVFSGRTNLAKATAFIAKSVTPYPRD